MKHLQHYFWEFDASNSRSNFFLAGGTDVEHLHCTNNFSFSSSIDPEQIEEYYLRKNKNQGMKLYIRGRSQEVRRLLLMLMLIV